VLEEKSVHRTLDSTFGG